MSGLESAVPDLCNVYKIYTESGSLINVYDWLIVSSFLGFLNRLMNEQMQVGVVWCGGGGTVLFLYARL